MDLSNIRGQKNQMMVSVASRKVCKLTLYDDGMPGVTIDEYGISNIAKDSLWRLNNEVFSGDEGARKLTAWVNKIKHAGRNRDYDCIIGLSGGVDSSIVAARVVDLGLRPLAIHLDNGWNSEIAVSNIERIVKRLNIDLITHVINWEEIKDLQRAYIKASVLDLECVSDHAINTVLYKTASKLNIGYVIHGGNVATESTMPKSWGYDKRDGLNLLSIHKRYGALDLRTYPYMRPYQLFFYLFIRGIKAFPILNYIDYNKRVALLELKERFAFTPYPRKHGENRFTRFFQEIYLPRKFGIDKRVAHYSSLMLVGEMTREEALNEISKPLYSSSEERDELEFVAKKLGFTVEELEKLISSLPRKHTEFPNAQAWFDHDRFIVQVARRFAKGEISIKDFRELWRRHLH